MKKIIAAVFVLSIWSQADGATKSRLPRPKPAPRFALGKIAFEETAYRSFRTRLAVQPMTANNNLGKLVWAQRPPLAANPFTLPRTRYTTFGSALIRPPKATYWQVGCGKLSFGRIYQGRNDFLTLSIGVGLPRCSYQHGTYTTWETIQPGLSLGGSFGGSISGGGRVINVPFASYTTAGFHHVLSDGLKVESIGKGSPQAAVALTLTLPTQ